MLKPKTVDDYISNSAEESQFILNEIRKIIKSTIPKAEEVISWNVPFYKFNGPVAGFAVYKDHVSFGIANRVIESEIRKALEKNGYKTGKKTLQIKFQQKVPIKFIKQLLRSQIKFNEAERSTN